jgi:tetratricopeptide (TPR) repeat protein
LSLAERARKWSRRHPRLASSLLVGAVACLLLLAGGAALIGVRRSLAQTREQLTAARDEERRTEFRKGTQRTLCLINTAADEHSHLDEGVRQCEKTLGLYEVLDRDDWQDAPAWRRLGREDRAELAQDVRELLLLLAWARRRSGQGAEALSLLDRAEAIEGLATSRALLEERAACLEERGDRTRALACRGRAAEVKPADARDFYLLAAAHSRQGRYDESIALLDEALRRNPTHYWSMLQRGICYLEKGKYALAAGDFGACVGVWPEFAWGYFNRGYALGKAGDVAEAIRDYTRALERDPDFLAARLNRGMARLELRQYAGALEDLDAASRGGRDDAYVHLGRGVALEGLARHEEADAAFDRARALASRASAEVMVRLWWVYGFATSARLPERAWEAFGKVLERYPEHREALYGRAMLLTGWKREAEAVKTYDRLLRAHPGFTQGRRYRAILLARRGDLTEAAKDVNRCLEQEPESGAVLYAAACVAALGSKGGRDAKMANQAVDLLKTACARGYGREQAASDPDLEAVHNHPGFAAALKAK